jgi:hypothetical protein
LIYLGLLLHFSRVKFKIKKQIILWLKKEGLKEVRGWREGR